MKLDEIVNEIVDIFEGICMGTVSVSIDPLDTIMGGVSPQDVLDEIISPVGFKVQTGEEPTKEELQKLIDGLKRFGEVFNCSAVDQPIEDLENYVNK